MLPSFVWVVGAGAIRLIGHYPLKGKVGNVTDCLRSCVGGEYVGEIEVQV